MIGQPRSSGRVGSATREDHRFTRGDGDIGSRGIDPTVTARSGRSFVHGDGELGGSGISEALGIGHGEGHHVRSGLVELEGAGVLGGGIGNPRAVAEVPQIGERGISVGIAAAAGEANGFAGGDGDIGGRRGNHRVGRLIGRGEIGDLGGRLASQAGGVVGDHYEVIGHVVTEPGNLGAGVQTGVDGGPVGAARRAVTEFVTGNVGFGVSVPCHGDGR